MKSRIITAAPLILSYGLDDVQSDKLSLIAKDLGMTHKLVPNESKDEKIGYLCGFKGFNKSDSCTEHPLDKQCLIFSGVQRKELDKLLKQLKSAELIIPLKAMVTPSNQSWTLSALVTELQKEHEFMTRNK